MYEIYNQHKAAFKNVSAFVIAKDGKRVATVALKYGAGCTAYVHWIGVTMQRATAGGGGYDRSSAAVLKASEKIKYPQGEDDRAFRAALGERDGEDWIAALRRVGFEVWSVI